jgi:hypothetical protein
MACLPLMEFFDVVLNTSISFNTIKRGKLLKENYVGRNLTVVSVVLFNKGPLFIVE